MGVVENAICSLWKATSIPAIALIAIALVFGQDLPRASGMYFPVTSQFEMVSNRVDGDERTLSFAFDKYRECEYAGLSFYWRDSDGTLVRIPWTSADPKQDASNQDLSRPAGKNLIHVNLSSTYPPENLHARVAHSWCPFPWKVVTVVWP